MTTAPTLARAFSVVVAKPYRSHDLESPPYLNEKGLLDFAPDDIENPKNWSVARKWYITTVAVSLVVNATFASSSPSGVYDKIATEFGVSKEAGALVITLFLLGYVCGPLLFAPLSEFYGRRYIFYITFTLYLIFNIPCALAQNFETLLIGRFLTGVFASAPLSNAPGVLADIWGPIERGKAMAVFSMMTFIGPALGPVISGFLGMTVGWRWTFWVLLGIAGVTEIFMFTIPETHASQILLNKAKRLRKAGWKDVRAPAESEDRSLVALFKVALTRPWRILIDPISFLVAIYLSVVYALLYMLFTIYPIVFQQRRGWNAGVGELPLIGVIIGACMGGAVVFYDSNKQAKKITQGHKLIAEDSLPVACLGGIVFAVSMFWFAWTAEFNSIHWIVPCIAGTFLSASILLIFVAFLNYVTSSYLMYAASALAANTVCRSAMGAAAPLYTSQMFKTLGIGGGGSLVGGVAVLLAPIPFIFLKYGEGIRKRSKFAPTDDEPSPDDPPHHSTASSDSEDVEKDHNSERQFEKDDAAETCSASSTTLHSEPRVVGAVRNPRNLTGFHHPLSKPDSAHITK